MADGIELRLFGEFQIAVDGQPRHLSLVAGKKLLAYLWIHEGERLSRSSVAALLWPGEPEVTTRPRLRTTLAALKTGLNPYQIIEADKSSIQLIAGAIQCDVEQAQELHRTSHYLTSPHDKVEGIEAFLHIAQSPMNLLLGETWGEGLAQEFVHLVRQSHLRVIREAQVLGEWDLGCRHAEELIRQNPADQEAWRAFLDFGKHLDKPGEVRARFKEVYRAQPQEVRARFSNQFLQDMKRAGDNFGLSPQQTGIASRVLKHLLENTPGAALEFLGSLEFREEAFAHPQDAMALCAQALAKTEGIEENRQACIVNLLIAANAIGDAQCVLKWAPAILQNTSNVRRKRGTASVLASAQFSIGKYEEASESLELSLQYALEYGEKEGISLARGQLGLHLIRLNRFDEGIPHMERAIEEMANPQGRQNRESLASMQKEMAWVRFMQHDFPESQMLLSPSLALFQELGSENQLAECLCLASLLKSVAGSQSSALTHLAKSLTYGFTGLSQGLYLNYLDRVALALSHVGFSSEGRAVFEVRSRLTDSDSKPELPVVLAFRELAQASLHDVKPRADWLLFANAREVIVAVSRLLASQVK